MSSEKFEQRGNMVFLLLSSLFIGLLVTCNLIFKKFVSFSFFGIDFSISAGVLPYPLTFLVTDLISEIFGAKKANSVVLSGLVVSVLISLVVLLAEFLPAMQHSPVDNITFSKVFGLTGPAVFASMLAYITAQFVDIRIYHFWKKITGGKHLWLRNNFSTVSSQLVDTGLVLLILCVLSALPWNLFWILFWNSFLFKFLAALIDTPILYLLVYQIRKYLGIRGYEEFTS